MRRRARWDDGRMKRAVLVTILGCMLAVSGVALAQPAPEQTVDIIQVEGAIDPQISEYLRSRLEQAQEDGVHAAVIQLDTPGGLDVSMREIVQEVRGSEVPIVVWLAPRGARAASAGPFIAYAAHLTFMPESTELWAATPTNSGGAVPEALEQKTVNAAAAFLREL